jgi:ADP-heptose:LPS heptosyltransferase
VTRAAIAEHILVIKLGALGDVVQALGPFAAIRSTHRSARITLLTTAAFGDFLAPSGLFDDIWIDERPPITAPGRWLALRRRLRGGGFARIYDLQTSDRSGWYFRLLGPGRRPQWCGIVAGCSHRHIDAARDRMHTIDRQKAQLAVAGIDAVPAADLSWVAADIARFALPRRFALIVPGGSAHRPGKRWPAERFAALCGDLAQAAVTPVIIGGAAEQSLAARIIGATGGSAAGGAIDLTGRTGLADIVALARGAGGAIGNDTGPMHLIAAAGCPSVVLFSGQSDPALAAPRGAAVVVLRRDDLADLTTAAVRSALTLHRP